MLKVKYKIYIEKIKKKFNYELPMAQVTPVYTDLFESKKIAVEKG